MKITQLTKIGMILIIATAIQAMDAPKIPYTFRYFISRGEKKITSESTPEAKITTRTIEFDDKKSATPAAIFARLKADNISDGSRIIIEGWFAEHEHTKDAFPKKFSVDSIKGIPGHVDEAAWQAARDCCICFSVFLTPVLQEINKRDSHFPIQ